MNLDRRAIGEIPIDLSCKNTVQNEEVRHGRLIKGITADNQEI